MLVHLINDDTPDVVEYLKLAYQYLAIAAMAIAVIYFIIYHFVCKPRCSTGGHLSSNRQHSTVIAEGKTNELQFFKIKI